MEHGLKYIALYVQKHMTTQTVCYNFLLVGVKPLKDTRIFETSLLHCSLCYDIYMITSSNGNILRVTGFLWGEITGHWWIPLTKTSEAEL